MTDYESVYNQPHKKCLLLDGEIGGLMWKHPDIENIKSKLVPASICLDDLNHIKSVHIEYLNAGCDVITVNSYAIVQQRLEGILGYGREDSEAAWNKMMENALKAANDARHEWVGHETNSEAQRTILIAGSLPPLHGSYKPNEVGKYSRILETYKNRNGKNLRFSNSAKK